MPVVRGSCVVFSHRVCHWGSNPELDCQPRVAMSFAVADPEFEKENFPMAKFAPFPPLSLRVGLRAGQAILYANQVFFKKHGLALDSRIFRQARDLYFPEYFEKIDGMAQSLKFVESRNRGR